jgi:SAM-dependent methyltransferase
MFSGERFRGYEFHSRAFWRAAGGKGYSGIVRKREYIQRGDYHKHLDPSWVYYSTYVLKMEQVRTYLAQLSPTSLILDLGCGEGVLVEEFRQKGYLIWGLDRNYGGSHIILGDATALSFSDDSFDVILLLDVIEHLSFDLQTKALQEVARTLKVNGELIASFPNLAHLNSRLRFFIRGELHRTASITKHPGDRPIAEYYVLLEEAGFKIVSRKGFTPTIPLLATKLLRKFPAQLTWLDSWLSRVFPPEICFVNLIRARRERHEPA